MTAPTTGETRLADYRPPDYVVDWVELAFRLDPEATRVASRICFRPNPGADPAETLHLDGAGPRLLRAAIDGEKVEVRPTSKGLSVAVPARPFLWEAEVEIAPAKNTALEGLYMSNGLYCTQCEAEGFRRITFYPDRPDVMAPFRVRIEGPEGVLLSNGNPIAQGPGWAEWDDPWPKPSYLFALVAGDLRAVRATFTTATGRDVSLAVWVRPGDENRAGYALDALARAMRWDEDVYGRIYDLDVFNLVAVDDFNAGAMENKGLNIFNAKYVLASPETATDDDYAGIESVVAHEYFHNWTGNRITCRDWFQLCLKEGLTVYRDQHFTADMRSSAVKRIEDARALRATQFREDAGPLAHPVRPAAYQVVDNFYTATIYEKGAELVGMLRRLVGETAWRAGLELYFERHDGKAATVEDWLACFAETSHRDLSRFALWYDQAGTPRVTVSEKFQDGAYSLTLSQHTPPTPGQSQKLPMTIPIAVGLLGPNGVEMAPTRILELTEAQQTFTWDGLEARPIPSVLRGFSAPVIVERPGAAADRLFLAAHDTDPFARWEAGHGMFRDAVVAMVTEAIPPDPALLDTLVAVVTDEAVDPAFRALALARPTQEVVATGVVESGRTPDPTAIWHAVEAMTGAIAARLGDDAARLYANLCAAEDAHEGPDAMGTDGPVSHSTAFDPGAGPAGRRALQGALLALVARQDGGAAARRQFARARNMTVRLAALRALLEIGTGAPQLEEFEKNWGYDRLVLDKWFAMQIRHAHPDRAVETATRLTDHPAFHWRNPNRFRAVVGALVRNPAGFHAASGAGYRFLAHWLAKLDPLNPQIAARLATAFETWRRYDKGRQERIVTEIRGLQDRTDLSPDMAEILARVLHPPGRPVPPTGSEQHPRTPG